MAIEFRNGIDIVGFTRPTPTPTPTPSVTPTVTPTITITPSVTPSVTPTITVTSSSVSITQTPTVTPTNTVTPTITPTNVAFVTSGLVLNLDANNSSSYPNSGNTWYDTQGTQQNITLVNSPTFTYSTPSYFTFNGSNQRGTGTETVLTSTGYTKSVWFYLNAYAANNIVSSSTGGHYMFFQGGNKMYNGHSNWAGFPSNYPSTSTFSLNTWYNVTLTFNTTDGMKLYVNGVLDSTYTTIKTAFTGNGSIDIASYANGNLLNGRISKVMVYDRSITHDEVIQNYDADRGIFGLPAVTPTPTPTSTVTPTITPSITPTNSVTPTPTVTPTNSITPTNTVTPTPTKTVTPTPTIGGLASNGLMFNLQTAPSTGTTWTDVSGNGRSATLQGTPTYVSNNGGGIKLNNSAPNGVGNDYISVPYNISSNTVTVEIVASFNPNGFWATIWGNESYTAGRGYLAFMTNASTIYYGKSTAPTSETITASNSIRHWTFVINGTQHSLYLNGVQVGVTDTMATQTLFATSELYFGARHVNNGVGPADRMNNTTASLQPVFYQMRLYNRALSGSEITANFNSIRGTYGL